MATVALVACVTDIEALLTEALRQEGHVVHALPLRGDTVSVLGKMKLDAVLVDGHPFTDLPAILKEMRAQEGTRDLPAVVVAARERTDLNRLGWVEQVEMPFDLQEFLAAVRRAVDAHGKHGG